jgi:hypothetical protein
MEAAWLRNLVVGVAGAIIAAACGHADETPSEPRGTDERVGTARAAVTALAAPGWDVVVTARASQVDFPLDKICLHRRADATCIVPSPDDADADGFPIGRDCDDKNPYAYPGAPEAKCDGIDEDCDGVDLCPPDVDQDGYSPPADCDDKDPTRNPGAVEIFCNGRDENCNGVDDCDADHDGESVPGDCNDHDPTIGRHLPEIFCDGIDQNCDGSDCCANDADGDGAPCSSDCDDKDPLTYPGAPVPAECYYKDVNCDGVPDGVCHRRASRRCILECTSRRSRLQDHPRRMRDGSGVLRRLLFGRLLRETRLPPSYAQGLYERG